MGTTVDYHHRNKLREDNADIQWRIKMARRWIFEQGVSLTSVWLKRTLGPLSLTPTRNAFSIRLAEHGFNLYSMYTPDLMHEFELGVWKSTLIHLVRLLHAFGGDRVQMFNQRYRHIPTFGHDTIRRFVNNMAGLKKMAARNYEDSLQCASPVFDGLPPNDQDNKIILDPLFDYGCWHSLAKLRLHTDDTQSLLNTITVHTSASVHNFARTTCARYETYELPRESAARGRRTAALASRGKGKGTAGGRKLKSFSTTTYKYHALWDYSSTIPMFGPSDIYSTLYGELEHKVVKRFYARTNKNNHAGQIARHVHLRSKMQRLTDRVGIAQQPLKSRRDKAGRSHSRDNAGAPTNRYVIAESQREYDDILVFACQRRNDPAYQSFVPQLREHILSRMHANEANGGHVERSPERRNCIHFMADRIYHHWRVRINYTTYDMQRSQDVINSCSHPDIMVLHHDDEHCHPRVGFVPFDSGGSFGFLDPALVIRGSHICPLFRYGFTDTLLAKSSTRDGQNYYEDADHYDEDYTYYLVNMFVDRDMFMRYLGGTHGSWHEGLCGN
ncbi:hypothetical protein DICSQDRAFT_72416 [Dichomitus squalens LYAD-421 SS1]|uniref:Uncharacterized protein n=1 Tax=Dichomitus squalens (strain LYAD-421) TaxID=732165 RepID=R7SJ81_DICSQ|nr:uncharacterized protein DICSQDRAFT_72416 [Dichomitus squalens LYAD-421 SS1]EJF55943.1 hypothetical protein DICSQDRAFT_72416 [Dichomitus squalens LYAD-421 SS1]